MTLNGQFNNKHTLKCIKIFYFSTEVYKNYEILGNFRNIGDKKTDKLTFTGIINND
jgi:hypothetical protein